MVICENIAMNDSRIVHCLQEIIARVQMDALASKVTTFQTSAIAI